MTTLTPEKEAELRGDVRYWQEICHELGARAEAAEKEVERLSQSPWITEAGFKDAADLIDMGRVGQSLIEAIADLRRSPGWEHWMPADGPAEIVFDLLNALADAQAANEALSALPPPVPAEEGGELRPCPFGCAATPYIHKGNESHWGFCKSCHCEGPICTSEAEARVAWNTRPTQAPQDVAGLVEGDLEWLHLQKAWVRSGDGVTDRQADTEQTARVIRILAALRASPISQETDVDCLDALAAAYEQGCIDTHNAIQAEPELAQMAAENADFGEAAQDYALAAFQSRQEGKQP